MRATAAHTASPVGYDEVFLGGYCFRQRDSLAWQLFPDSPDLEGIPERAGFGRNPTTYLMRSAIPAGKAERQNDDDDDCGEFLHGLPLPGW